MPKPLVTGISPKEGYPGTKVIIRGEFLGKDEEDLVAVIICGVDCTIRAKWEKESRITTYTGFCKGKGDIVIVTNSGGRGTSSVGFQGLVKKNIGPYEETCTWVDEDSKALLTGLKRAAVNELSHDNPLNISLDDSSKYGMDFFDKEFPNSSIDMTQENFNASRFLLENYQNAKFEDLRQGLEYMKRNIGSKTINSTDNLLKNNISSFMDAIKIMKDIHWLSSNDKKNEFTRSIELMFKDILKTAHRIYDQDLASKDRADMIRNSLQILDTYKSLIYFPQNVDKWLKLDDYEQIITSYKLAKMQLSKAEPATRKSTLFAQIKKDLDSSVLEVQKHILKKLIQFPSSPDEQKFLIENYISIENIIAIEGNKRNEVAFNPAWYCLTEEKKWFIQLMLECRDMHIADEKVSLAMKQSDDSNNNNSKQEQKNSSDVLKDGKNLSNNILNNTEASKIQVMTQIPHERNKFIEELCQMFFDIFTDYWRLGSMYLGNLFNNLPSTNNDSIKANEYHGLVGEILETFCNIVRAAFIPHTFDKSLANTNLLSEWPIQHDAQIISQILPHCLKVCRLCAQQIFSLDIQPKQFECVKILIYDLRCECLVTLLSQPTREILATLGFEEPDWIVDRDVDSENNSCLITNLPSRFEAKFNRALSLCKEYVLDDKKGEKSLFKDPVFSKKIAMLLYGISHAFMKRINRFMSKEDSLPKFVQMSRSKLLLYLYNNLTVCKRKALPNIWQTIANHKYQQFDQVIKESKKNLKELQDMLLKQYVSEATKPIVDNIESNLYAGRYDFSECSAPLTVRNYVKQIIMSLLNIHSELFLLNKSLIQAVLTQAVKEIYTKLFSLFVNIPNFCVSAAIQAYIDIFCLKETFKLYTSDESKEILHKILKLIPSNSFEQNKSLMTKLIGDFEKGMQPYLAVFHTQPPTSSVNISLQSNENK
ncbi:unnamed protein product [Brachionus calyciflorus]|uniref:Exocyst complex component 2 n=1 Tax=Brachionus calyciflorus TaxID=104777 RepID=A0A813ZKB0_9BILA|nr:unnamed protein product [Brachionus calyciflorus]